jgi:hypothetical protein
VYALKGIIGLLIAAVSLFKITDAYDTCAWSKILGIFTM